MMTIKGRQARLTWHVKVAACIVLVAGLAGCGDDEAGPGTGSSGNDWPAATSPVATDGLVWAVDSTVHLPDDSTIEVGTQPGGFVVSSAGVWFLGGEVGPDELPRLRLATPEGKTIDTSAHPASMTASADGRWLAFIDQPEGSFGPAEAVVVDTVEGIEVLRSREGLVPEDDDVDWTDLYEELPVHFIAVIDDVAYLRGLDDIIAVDLTTGERSVVDPPLKPEHPWWNSAHTWAIPRGPITGPATLQPADGPLLTTHFAPRNPGAPPPVDGDPDLESWTLTGWLDEATAVGLTHTLGKFDTMPILVTCVVPSGDCTLVPGTERGVNLPMDRTSGLPSQWS